jgi:nucleotide-binding universal stress UspA family protein
MYAQVLVATDGSELATRALDHAIELAKLAGSTITVVTVTDPLNVYMGGYAGIAGTTFDPVPEVLEAQLEGARQLLKAAEARVTAAGVPAKTVLVENAFAAEGIISTAESIGATLIVMGSHGRRALGRLLLGSQTNEVLAHSKIPVLVTR